jgi:hypothetical protein
MFLNTLLVHRRGETRPGHYYWIGERVELNAMTSDQLIAWLERKLAEIGVQKVIPDRDALANAYRRAVRQKQSKRRLMMPSRASMRMREFLFPMISKRGSRKNWMARRRPGIRCFGTS